MDPLENLSSLIDQLDDNIDDLENALSPLVQAALSETALKLPLLDRAKLYTLTTYAIESVLFSFVKLNGSDAKEHPVFKELARVKQYFEKIKSAEASGQRPNLRVDQAAAGRMIKHDLAANQRKGGGADVNFKLPGLASGTGPEVLPSKRKFDQTSSAEPPQGPKPDSDENSTTSSDESSDVAEAGPSSNKQTIDQIRSTVNLKQGDPVNQISSPKEKQRNKAKTSKQRSKKRNRRQNPNKT